MGHYTSTVTDRGETHYLVTSAGPDGRFGTADDITEPYWRVEGNP